MAKKEAAAAESGETPKSECYADGTPAAVGDLVLIPSYISQTNKKTRREAVLIHIAKGAGESNGVVAFAEAKSYPTEMETLITVTTVTQHVTISKCEKSGLETEW